MASPSIDPPPASYSTFPSNDGRVEPCAMTPPNNGSAVPSNVCSRDDPENAQWQDPAEYLDETPLWLLRFESQRVHDSKFLVMALWAVATLTVLCIMIAIHHWAAYVFLAPVLIFTLYKCSNSKESHTPSPDESRKMALWSYETGRIADFSIGAAGSALLCCFSITGLYLVKHNLWSDEWGDGSWVPDLDKVDASPQLALWFWFFVLAMVSFCSFSVWFIALAILYPLTLYRKKYNQPQPAKGPPPVPTITDFPPHVFQCALPFTVFSIGVACGMTYNKLHDSKALMWIGIAGVLVSFIWFMGRLGQQLWITSRLHLCIDWATDVDNVPVDPDVKKLLAFRGKIQDNYILAALWFLLLLIPTAFIVERSQPSIAITAVVYFVLLYLGLWGIWRNLKVTSNEDDDVDDETRS